MSLRLSGGRRLQSPPGLATRPTPARVRQAVMNMLAPRLADSRWLDLCCGSGAMACEALQHGAATVVAVDADRRTAELARRNLDAVAGSLRAGAADHQVLAVEVVGWLRRGRPAQWEPFDLIYADPPYAAGLHDPISQAVLDGRWLAADGLLLLECSSRAMAPCPVGWRMAGKPRTYGQTSLVVLGISPRERCPADTDSRPPQTTPPG